VERDTPAATPTIPAAEQGPRKLFSKPAERREDMRRVTSASAVTSSRVNRPAPLRAQRCGPSLRPGNPAGTGAERENRFRRDEPAQENAPRKLFSKPAERRKTVRRVITASAVTNSRANKPAPRRTQ
jgi:putative N6-adenine-specific DNA methylase